MSSHQDAHSTTQSPEQLNSPTASSNQPASATPHHVRQTPQRRPSSPNASSAPITQASGADTHGIVNRHPQEGADGTATAAASVNSGAAAPAYKVGVSEDRNKKCRRTMEDSHAFVYDYGGVKGQGYFAVFDGHAGKHSAEWCGVNFHKYLLKQLRDGQDSQPIPDLLNQTFHIVDGELSKIAAQGGTHSGCTAVTAFLRLEDENGNAVQLEHDPNHSVGSSVGQGGAAGASNPAATVDDTNADGEDEEKKKGTREKIKSLFSSNKDKDSSSSETTSTSTTQVKEPAEASAPPALPKNLAKRTLYTANVGDARAVLSRGGKAVRLTYDHKGSDAQEAKRITDAGGFVMNNRVNGVLAVTRSLGDSSMKEFVVGSPYTTETTLGDDDEFLIIACDGLWDVCEDQTAVDLLRDTHDAQAASKILLDHALTNFSTDNLSVLVVSLKP